MSLTDGTQTNIFNTAIELFSKEGYENISMKKLAHAVGIQAASIYNHFPSKESILDEIYSYYEEHYFDNCCYKNISDEQLKTSSAEELMSLFAWNFSSLPEDIRVRLTRIAKIIYSRFIIDERANKFFRDIMLTKCLDDLTTLFERLKSMGRLHKDFEIKPFCEALLYACLMIGITNIANASFNHEVDNKDYVKKGFTDILAISLK